MILADGILNKVKVFDEVEVVLNRNNASWSGNVGFTKIANRFITNEGKIKLIVPDQMLQSSPGTITKDATHTNCINMASTVGNVVMLWAEDIDDTKKEKTCMEQLGLLYTASDEEFGGVCKNIYDLGSNNFNGASTFGLTQQMLTDLQSEYLKFNSLVSSTRDESELSTDEHNNLVRLIKLNSKDLWRMKRLMGIFANVHPFHNEFIIAAKYIKHTPVPRSVRGKATAKATGNIIANAKIELTNEAGNKYNYKSSEKGNITVPHLPEGKYTVKASYIGMKDIIEEIYIHDGLTSSFNPAFEAI